MNYFIGNQIDCMSFTNKSVPEINTNLDGDFFVPSTSESVYSNYCDQFMSTINMDNNCNQVILMTPEFPYYMRTLATFFCAIILIIGLIGNILVPFVVYKTKELKNSTNYFLINLSFSDLLVLIVCVPTVLNELHSKPEVWSLGLEMCKAVPFVEMVVAHGSILTMMAISFERYYAICKPLKANRKCTQMRASLIIVSIWAVAISLTAPVLLIAELGESKYVDGSVVPVCLTNANRLWHKLYFVITMIGFFWGPLVVLIVIYVLISKRLFLSVNIIASSNQISSSSHHHNHSNHHHHYESSQMRARKQVVYMLATVIACFFICLLPFRMFTLWLLFSSSDQISSIGMEAYYTSLYFCRVMLYLNSAINPILYNLISSKFREAFLAVVCCKRNNRQLLRHGTFHTTSSSTLISLKNSIHKNGQPLTSDKEIASLTQKRINPGTNNGDLEASKEREETSLIPNQLKFSLGESFV